MNFGHVKSVSQVGRLRDTEENIAGLTVSKGSRDISKENVACILIPSSTVMKVLRLLLTLFLSVPDLMAVVTNLVFFISEEVIPFDKIQNRFEGMVPGPCSDVSVPNSIPEIVKAYFIHEILNLHPNFNEEGFEVPSNFMAIAILVTSLVPPPLKFFLIDPRLMEQAVIFGNV